MEKRCYKGPPKRALVLPLDLDKGWDELEWTEAENKLAAGKERNAWRARTMKRFHQITRRIAKDFERERKQMLAAALKRQRELDLELVLLEHEEKHRLANEKDLAESRCQSAAYIDKIRGAMQALLKKEHDKHAAEWAPTLARVAKINREMALDRIRVERHELLMRGVIRGRRHG